MTTTTLAAESLKVRRCALFAARRPSDVVIGALGICRRMVRRNLADPASPVVPCGTVTSWRLHGKTWCPRCWTASPEGVAAVAELAGADAETDR